jgi:hypothetical protein
VPTPSDGTTVTLIVPLQITVTLGVGDTSAAAPVVAGNGQIRTGRGNPHDSDSQ